MIAWGHFTRQEVSDFGPDVSLLDGCGVVKPISNAFGMPRQSHVRASRIFSHGRREERCWTLRIATIEPMFATIWPR